MTAYSFQARFIAPILARTKRQTIRAVGLRHHAKPGGELQLYRGMRTKGCFLIARSTCIRRDNILIDLLDHPFVLIDGVGGFGDRRRLNRFARADGFADWDDMVAFWQKEHPSVTTFAGIVTTWGKELRDTKEAEKWLAANSSA